MARKIISIASGIFGALCMGVALTVPVFAATGPAIVAIFFLIAAWFIWPKSVRKGQV
jgi:hypothetical protein